MGISSQVKLVAAGIVTVVTLLIVGLLWGGLVGHNNFQNYQIQQSVTGTVSVRDTSGYYWKGFATVWTMPRSIQTYYSAAEREGGEEDESITVTFNDGGTAKISSFVKIQLPTDEAHRSLIHQDYSSNEASIIAAVRAHLVNCVKSTGPMMSASENQASRKAEFNQVVEDQLTSGLFEMRRTEVELNDTAQFEAAGVGSDGKPIMRERKAKVLATEIVRDSKGKPIIVQDSPLNRYGIKIIQFSVTETEYDQQTLQQFAAKKQSYLAAEQAKAQRQEEQQQRLMIIEKGLRQVAETEAASNLLKKKATVEADKEREVAVINKAKAVTQAQQKVEVAEQERQEAETRKAIAAIKAETADLEKKATVLAAEARAKQIEIGGGLSERDKILAQIKADRDAKVAAALSTVKTPTVVIVGGKDGQGGDLTSNLMNLMLLKSTGILAEK
jgi:hypothetical protein